MRILLVEDHPDLSLWLAKALRAQGFAVDAIADGHAADQVLKSEEYALAILDLNLPKLDGLEVLRKLRARGQTLPVLVLTARGETSDRVAGLNLGADDYVSKPFELSELEARVKALLRRSQSGALPRLTCGSLAFDSVSRTFELGGKLLALTPREAAVLQV